MHGHINGHQVHWYVWGNISASISAALTLHHPVLASLPVLPCLAAAFFCFLFAFHFLSLHCALLAGHNEAQRCQTSTGITM